MTRRFDLDREKKPRPVVSSPAWDNFNTAWYQLVKQLQADTLLNNVSVKHVAYATLIRKGHDHWPPHMKHQTAQDYLASFKETYPQLWALTAT